jgi:nucleotide-binding universal stress UspA family protein
MTVRKILVPVAFFDASLDVTRRAVHQAAYLARRLHAEIILLHVMTPLGYPAGMFEGGHELTARDVQAEVVRRAQAELDQSFRAELDGLVVKRMLLRGRVAHEIARIARDEQIDLIVMPTHGSGALDDLLGSVTTRVLHQAECPVWTGAHLEETSDHEFSIQRVLCAIDLTPHSRHTLVGAAQLAREFDARLTLVHVTESVEIYGPGGSHVIPEMKEALVSYAGQEIATLQRDLGTGADVRIESGNVRKLLSRVAAEVKADVLVIGHRPSRGHLGANLNGYSIIRDVHIPVLSV